MVMSQQPVNSLPARDRPVAGGRRCCDGKRNSIANSLMRPLALMMRNVFVDGVYKRRLAEEDHSVETFLVDRKIQRGKFGGREIQKGRESEVIKKTAKR